MFGIRFLLDDTPPSLFSAPIDNPLAIQTTVLKLTQDVERIEGNQAKHRTNKVKSSYIANIPSANYYQIFMATALLTPVESNILEFINERLENWRNVLQAHITSFTGKKRTFG